MNVSGERKSCISDAWGSKGILLVVFLAGTMSLQGCVELNSRACASGPPCHGYVLGDIQVLTWYLHATATTVVEGFLSVTAESIGTGLSSGVPLGQLGKKKMSAGLQIL